MTNSYAAWEKATQDAHVLLREAVKGTAVAYGGLGDHMKGFTGVTLSVRGPVDIVRRRVKAKDGVLDMDAVKEKIAELNAIGSERWAEERARGADGYARRKELLATESVDALIHVAKAEEETRWGYDDKRRSIRVPQGVYLLTLDGLTLAQLRRVIAALASEAKGESPT